MYVFEQRRITQRGTAENLINSIATNNTKKRENAVEEYEKKIEKYDTTLQAGERMAERASKAREGKQIKNGLRENTKASGTVGIIHLNLCFTHWNPQVELSEERKLMVQCTVLSNV